MIACILTGLAVIAGGAILTAAGIVAICRDASRYDTDLHDYLLPDDVWEERRKR